VGVITVARRGLKLKVTVQGQEAVGLTSNVDRGKFSTVLEIKVTSNLQHQHF